MTPVAAVVVAFSALAVYRATLLPGLGFWDTGEAQTVLPVLGTMHPTGFPAFVVMGWLFSLVARPLGEPAFLMNLLAAGWTAAAVGATVVVVRRLGVPLAVSAAAGIGLALTPAVWHISGAIDAHALHLLLVVLLTWALIRWQSLVEGRRDRPYDTAFRRRGDRALILAAAVYGVAAANHGLALLLAPSIVLFVLAVEPRVLRRPGVVLAAVSAAAAVAILLYLELPLRAGPWRAPLVYAHPETWQGFWDIVLGRQFQGDVRGVFSDLPAKTRALSALGGAQFGPLVALIPVGLAAVALRRSAYALYSGSAVLVTVAFAGSYANADITRYYLGPVFFAWTWLALLAGSAVRVVGGRNAAAGREPAGGRAATATVVGLVLAGALLAPTALALGARRADVDQSHNTAAAAWLDAAFGAMARDAVVISWWSYSTPMWYGEYVEGRRPDILIIDDSTAVWDRLGPVPAIIDRYLGTRPVYVIRQSAAEVQALAGQYALQPAGRPGNLFRVTARIGATP